MNDVIDNGLSDEEQREYDHAVACGLTSRFGPLPFEVSQMPMWRRVALRVLPRRHRWRLSALAGDIRQFRRRVG